MKNDEHILADTFLVRRYRLRIFRIRQRDTATVLWTVEEYAVRHLQTLNTQKLQAEKKGR
jgi:triphosphoribosyl-dephospho-CoA synthetase